MPSFVLPAIMAGASALGGLFGNKPKTATSFNKSNSQTDTNFQNAFNNFSTFSNKTDYDPLLYAFRNKMLDTGMNLFDRVNLPVNDYVNSVLQQNVSGINKRAELQDKLFANSLAQRGLSQSPMGAFSRLAESSRVSDLINNSNLRPLLERQTNIENMNLEDARKALGTQIFQSIPKDTSGEAWQGGTSWGGGTSKTSSESIGDVNQSGNQLGGLFSSLGSLLAFLAGKGFFN